MAINPLWITAGASLASGVFELLDPNDAEDIMREVLADQQEWRETLTRRAHGRFTPAERRDIRRSAEPRVNQVAGSVAARGLGTSPGGAALVAQAQQAPFREAMAVAAANVASADMNTFNIARQMAAMDSGFHKNLGTMIRNYYTLKGLQQNKQTGALTEVGGNAVLEGIGTAIAQVSEILEGIGMGMEVAQ